MNPWTPIDKDKLPKRIYVDLDGTLTPSDCLWESIAALARSKPWALILLPVLLLRQRQLIKIKLAQMAPITIGSLPYRQELISWLRELKAAGHQIYLATASTHSIAESVAASLDLFDGVLASDDRVNLRGSAKAKAILDHAEGQPFCYIGDHAGDRAIWRHAETAVAVGASGSAALRKLRHPNAIYVQAQDSHPKAMLRAMRPHHWAKNALVFVPLITAHKLEPSLWWTGLLAFFSFSLMSSMVYICNDLVDLDADRQHHQKRLRPLASGALSIPRGLLVAFLCFLLAAFIASQLPSAYAIILAVYTLVTFAYSLFLKQFAIVDVLTLAGLFTLRVLAGGAATETPISPWLLAFSMFLFLSLAVLKRYAELHHLRTNDQGRPIRRGYRVSDLAMLSSIGVANGFVSVLVLALYISSPDVHSLYNRPVGIWMICPALVYWLSRLWLKAHRGEMIEDPLVFAFRDPASYVVGLVVAGLMLGSL